jgi:hypothetical protein
VHAEDGRQEEVHLDGGRGVFVDPWNQSSHQDQGHSQAGNGLYAGGIPRGRGISKNGGRCNAGGVTAQHGPPPFPLIVLLFELFAFVFLLFELFLTLFVLFVLLLKLFVLALFVLLLLELFFLPLLLLLLLELFVLTLFLPLLEFFLLAPPFELFWPSQQLKLRPKPQPSRRQSWHQSQL